MLKIEEKNGQLVEFFPLAKFRNHVIKASGLHMRQKNDKNGNKIDKSEK